MVSTNTPRHREVRLARLIATYRNLTRQEFERIYARPQVRRRRSVRILNRQRAAICYAINIAQPTLWLRLEQTIRLVVMRLGLDRDMRDLIVSLCIPSGTIGNACVLF